MYYIRKMFLLIVGNWRSYLIYLKRNLISRRNKGLLSLNKKPIDQLDRSKIILTTVEEVIACPH